MTIHTREVATRRSQRWTMVAALLSIAFASMAIPAAEAATAELTEVTEFGSNPGDLQMFEYVPWDLDRGAPLVVVMHGCFGTASAYDDETGWVQLAEARGWALVMPQQQITNNNNLCLNWVSEDDTRRGEGEAASIVEMVDWMAENRGIDRKRVFATGHSAGGYFTSVLLATYPDVFAAGAVVAGGPYRCATYQKLYLAPPGVWVDPDPLNPLEMSARMACTQGAIDRTPQQWGDLLRAGHSTYTGAKPRISLWHGSSDEVVLPQNLAELVEQWTNFHGIDMKPDVRDTGDGDR